MLLIGDLEYGGAQRQVIELANHLDPAHFEAHVCSLSDYIPLSPQLRHMDDRIHILKKACRFDVTVVPRLARLLRTLRIHILHSFLFDADIAARLAGRLAGTPVIINSERNTDYPLKLRHLAAYRLTKGCVDLIIANSAAGAEYNRSKLGHSPAQYRVVYNGVNTDRFVPGDGTAIRSALGIRPDEYLVGLFSSYKPQKNHPVFFAAARRVLDRIPRTRFLIVGDVLHGGVDGSADYKARMDRIVDMLGIRHRCVFLGNRDDVDHLYRACDLTVLCSLFEGTPNVILESMACGVPVIVTDVADNAHIVPHGRVGYDIAVNDDTALAECICTLLLDEPQRRRMGCAARDWVVREFSVTQLARDTQDVYLEALHRKREHSQ